MGFFLFLFVLTGIYFGLAVYYKEGFSYGTWINGIYCTGKSVDEVNKELTEHCFYEGIVLYDKEGHSYEIQAEQIDYRFDFKEALEKYLKEQNPYRWMDNLFAAKEKKLIPVISYDEKKLKDELFKIPDFADERSDEERKFYIRKTRAGYELVNERKDVMDKEKAQTLVEQALLEFRQEVRLKDEGCYKDLPLNRQMRQELEKWEKINDFQDCHIVYLMGEEKVPIDASVACEFIATDEEGKFLYDEAGNLQAEDKAIEAFVDRLADTYDTVGGKRYFKTTKGETVIIEGGIYGNKIDRKAEKKYLKQAFREKKKELHTPEYLQKGLLQGKNDIGDTYIEIDMTDQKMYYYRKGRLELETPVVTGNTGRRMGTPEGVNYVYSKQKNRILRGPNYASHVNFWMPVKGNIGIHDADWRSEFGGEIYKTSGSHGCINTPYEAMSRLYEMAEVGTPVVMFY